MKMRKKLAALLAAAMIASVMPMTAFATSSNRVTKPVNVKKGEHLTTNHAVELVVEMKTGDSFAAPDFFILSATDAEWTEAVYGDGKTAKDFGDYTIVKQSNTSLMVTSKLSGTDARGAEIRIPLAAKITGDTPTVEIDPVDSAVSADKFTLAVASTGKAIITVGSVPSIAGTDKMATITFDEPFIGSFEEGQTVTLELRDSDFSFVDVDKATLKGTNAFYGKEGTVDEGKNAQTIEIKLPALGKGQRGGFKLEDVKIKPNRNAREGEVKVTIDGKFVDKKVVTVAKYGDFTTTLKVEKDDYEVVAGKDIDVEFTLAEEMANALIGNRTVDFAFTKGIVINEIEVVEAKKLDGNHDKDSIVPVIATIARTGRGSDINTNEFSVDQFYPDVNEKSSYKFKANLLVPAGFEGDIELTAEGRGLEGKKEVVVAKTEAPVTVETKSTVVKVGLQKQETDATITIKETKEDRITKGEDIRVEIADRDGGIEFVSATVKVTEGDLELEKDDIDVDDGVIIIPVKRHSTEVSTIEITDIVITTNRSVPEGSYDVKVGGSALSDFTGNIHFGDKKSDTVGTIGSESEALEEAVLDAITTSEDFIVVGTPNTEDINNGKKAEVKFIIGNSKYLVDGVEVEMDAAPYIKDGRTMVPLRYLASALGISPEAIKFSSGTVTIFADAGRTIQVKVGSKDLIVNGMTVPMVAAAEIIEGRTYVPVTEIGAVFGVTGTWDAATQTATFK